MKQTYIFLVCLIFSAAAAESRKYAENSSDETEQGILNVLLDEEIYDASISPRQRAELAVSPIEVKATLFILDITSVNDLKNEFSVQLYFRQKWNDPRLSFAHMDTALKYLRVRDVDKVWKPDSFFVHELEGKLHTITMPNNFLRIYRDGEVFYSVRLSMTFGCKMDFRCYPLDSQKCSFIIESYGSGSNEIRYRWDDVDHPVGVSHQIDMPDFVLTDYKYSSDIVRFHHGNYSRLQVDLKLKRQTGLFLNKLYVPFIILVIASWLSFWIRPQFASLRLTLILTILFIMFWLESDVSRQTPRVSYTKAIDVWTGVCLSLVFAALLQFIFVSQLVRKEKHRRKQKNAVDPEALLITEGSATKLEKNSSLDNADTKAVTQLIARHLGEGKKLPDKVDIFFRVVFPIIFGVFNLIYWPVYCSGN